MKMLHQSFKYKNCVSKKYNTCSENKALLNYNLSIRQCNEISMKNLKSAFEKNL